MMINLPSTAASSINSLMRNTWRWRGLRVGWAEFRKPHPLLVYVGDLWYISNIPSFLGGGDRQQKSHYSGLRRVSKDNKSLL